MLSTTGTRCLAEVAGQEQVDRQLDAVAGGHADVGAKLDPEVGRVHGPGRRGRDGGRGHPIEDTGARGEATRWGRRHSPEGVRLGYRLGDGGTGGATGARGGRGMTASYDAIVVGLGGIGSAAAYRLAAAGGGRRILGLEQFELGHDRGASQDVSRITRLSYHRPEYVSLAIEAQAAWREVEAASGERIITITGGLDLAPPDAPESIDDYADSMTAVGVPFEWLDAGRGDAALAAVAPRGRDAGDLPGERRDRRSRARQRRPPAACTRRRRGAPRACPGDRDPRPRRRVRGRRRRPATRSPPVPSSSRPTPGPTTCWRRSGWSCR